MLVTGLITGLRRAAMTGLCTLLLALVLGAVTVQAQTAVCSNSPGTGERIECTEDATSTSDIDIDAEGIDIDTSFPKPSLAFMVII